jgi:hypothetical protein
MLFERRAVNNVEADDVRRATGLRTIIGPPGSRISGRGHFLPANLCSGRADQLDA